MATPAHPLRSIPYSSPEEYLLSISGDTRAAGREVFAAGAAQAPPCLHPDKLQGCSGHRARVRAHELQGGGDKVPVQLVTATRAHGKHPPGPGTPRLTRRPLSPRSHERFSIRLRGNTFSTSSDTSCLRRRQPRGTLRAGHGWVFITHPSTLRAAGTAGTSPRLCRCPLGVSEPTLGAQDGFGAAQRHLQACRHLTCLPGPPATSSASTVPCVGGFSASSSELELSRKGHRGAAGILGDAAAQKTSRPTQSPAVSSLEDAHAQNNRDLLFPAGSPIGKASFAGVPGYQWDCRARFSRATRPRSPAVPEVVP